MMRLRAEEFEYSCGEGSGCCYDHGFEHFIDNVLVYTSTENEIDAMAAALKHAGFEVEVEDTVYAEYNNELDEYYGEIYDEYDDDYDIDFDEEFDDILREEMAVNEEALRRLAAHDGTKIAFTIVPNDDGTDTAIIAKTGESKTFDSFSDAMDWAVENTPDDEGEPTTEGSDE